jgi:hypothetical protein
MDGEINSELELQSPKAEARLRLRQRPVQAWSWFVGSVSALCRIYVQGAGMHLEARSTQWRTSFWTPCNDGAGDKH